MNTELISIMGEDVVATVEEHDIHKLLFLPNNPRVDAAIRNIHKFTELTTEDQQEQIYQQLLKEPSFTNLRPEIEKDGGLQEPVIVRHDTMQVIEGNTRLAVYRLLHHQNPNEERWQSISCRVISKLTDDQQDRLLSQAHLNGKTEWSPYAKALFCFRRVHEEKKSANELADITGFTVRSINKYVEIIKLMHENEDSKESHYSYYDVVLGNQKISRQFNESQDLNSFLLSAIKKEEFTAQELRDRLPVVLQKRKVTKKFISGKINLEDAYDRAKVSQTKNKFDKILGMLEAIETKDIRCLDRAEVLAVRQVAQKVFRKSKRLIDSVEACVSESKQEEY